MKIFWKKYIVKDNRACDWFDMRGARGGRGLVYRNVRLVELFLLHRIQTIVIIIT